MRPFRVPEDFYQVYDSHRTYAHPEIRRKHLRNFDAQFWTPSKCTAAMSVLELGCGTGLFLSYLRARGVENFLGVEQDQKVLDFIPPEIAQRIIISDIWKFLDSPPAAQRYDRIALFDVLEHFSPYEGVDLLLKLKALLTETGRIVVRIPNMSSPWGLQYQFHDLTHKALYTPGSLRQLALAAGMDCIACLPQWRGSLFKQWTEAGLNALLRRLLTEAPEIMSANMIGVLCPRP